MEKELDSVLNVGFQFKQWHGPGNINNKPFLEIRAIVDNDVIVLYGETIKGRPFYEMIYISQFNRYWKDGIYKPIA